MFVLFFTVFVFQMSIDLIIVLFNIRIERNGLYLKCFEKYCCKIVINVSTFVYCCARTTESKNSWNVLRRSYKTSVGASVGCAGGLIIHDTQVPIFFHRNRVTYFIWNFIFPRPSPQIAKVIAREMLEKYNIETYFPNIFLNSQLERR